MSLVKGLGPDIREVGKEKEERSLKAVALRPRCTVCLFTPGRRPEGGVSTSSAVDLWLQGTPWLNRAEAAGVLSEGESEAAAGKLGRQTIPSPQIQAFALWSPSFTGTLQAAEHNGSSETRTCRESTTHVRSPSFPVYSLAYLLLPFQWA